MVDKMNAGTLSDPTLLKLQELLICIQEGNGQKAQLAVGALTRGCWADVKEFVPALKTMAGACNRG